MELCKPPVQIVILFETRMVSPCFGSGEVRWNGLPTETSHTAICSRVWPKMLHESSLLASPVAVLPPCGISVNYGPQENDIYTACHCPREDVGIKLSAIVLEIQLEWRILLSWRAASGQKKVPMNCINLETSLIGFPQSRAHCSLGSSFVFWRCMGEIPEITHVTAEGFCWVYSGAASLQLSVYLKLDMPQMLPSCCHLIHAWKEVNECGVKVIFIIIILK